MNFNNIKPVRKKESYMQSMAKKANVKGEKRKISSSLNYINDTLKNIISNFPSTESFTPFYKELMEITIGIDKYKRSIGRLDAIRKQIIKISKKALTFREFLARTDSILKKEALNDLENIRRTMRTFPDIKDVFTVCILGFPNVGKTTLFNKLTSSKAEINNYAFTTKTLNVSFIKKDYYTAQIIDTPGTLARPDKMNNVEKQAYCALKNAADIIIYVYDLSEDNIEDQIRLDKSLKEFGLPVYYYFSKKDIIDKRTIKEFIKKNGIKNIINNIKEEILKMAVKKRSIL